MKESEIRNRGTFDKYLELVKEDIKRFFDFDSFVNVRCPACNAEEAIYEFKKSGFIYVSCKACLTLFVNPRPPFQVLKEFYSKSPSADYFVKEFFAPVAEARKEKIFKPRAEYISRIMQSNKDITIGDIGAGFGLFLEEIKK